MSRNKETDEVVLCVHLWFAGSVYISGLSGKDTGLSAETSAFYPLNRVTAHLRLRDLVERGWAASSGEVRGPRTRGTAQRPYFLTEKGKQGLKERLLDRFDEHDVLETRALFFTCLCLLWDRADLTFFKKLIEIRVKALKSQVPAFSAAPRSFVQYPFMLVEAVTGATLKAEIAKLEDLVRFMETPDFEEQGKRAKSRWFSTKEKDEMNTDRKEDVE